MHRTVEIRSFCASGACLRGLWVAGVGSLVALCLSVAVERQVASGGGRRQERMMRRRPSRAPPLSPPAGRDSAIQPSNGIMSPTCCWVGSSGAPSDPRGAIGASQLGMQKNVADVRAPPHGEATTRWAVRGMAPSDQTLRNSPTFTKISPSPPRVQVHPLAGRGVQHLQPRRVRDLHQQRNRRQDHVRPQPALVMLSDCQISTVPMSDATSTEPAPKGTACPAEWRRR